MKFRSILLILCLIAVPLTAQNRASDLSRLQAILLDAQDTKVTFSADAWRITANEAASLANRIAANSKQKAARDLRTHVREMRDAALKGDADGARSHADMALPFANQLADSMSK
jgi:hypothetical protein